jgi:hypothetical protein
VCGGACNVDQNSHPVVDQHTGRIWVAFENYNTPSTVFNQLMAVSSLDGGQTWGAPVKITNVIDGPDVRRAGCTRALLTFC